MAWRIPTERLSRRTESWARSPKYVTSRSVTWRCLITFSDMFRIVFRSFFVFFKPFFLSNQKLFEGNFVLQMCRPEVSCFALTGLRWSVRTWFNQETRALSASSKATRICTAPFEYGQTAVVPSEGVQIWVCLFLYGRSLPRHPHDQPHRNKHTQICTPSLGTTAVWPYSKKNGAVQIRVALELADA